MNNLKLVKKLNSGSIYLKPNGTYIYKDSNDDYSIEDFQSIQSAIDAYYINEAYSYFGSSIRDNSHNDKIKIGKSIDLYGVDEQGCLIQEI